MIYAEERHIKIIMDILAKYPYNFFAFGSRVKGNQREFSDLDICFFDNIPWDVRSTIEEDFEESNLPYKVDLVDFHMCEKNFQDIIRKDMVKL
jgi:predicted nucleotidyltransferase